MRSGSAARPGESVALTLSLHAVLGTALEPGTPSPRHGPHLLRIRSGDARINASLRDGYRRSDTFRMLVDTLERAEVLVYVVPGRCRPMDVQKLAACLADLGVARGVHQVRIIIDVGLATDHLIATLGHELQHAVEVSRSTVENFSDRAQTGTSVYRVRAHVYETAAAERLGQTISRELRRQTR